MIVNFERSYEELASAKGAVRDLHNHVTLAADLPLAQVAGVCFTIRSSCHRWVISEWLGCGNGFVPKNATILIARKTKSKLGRPEFTKIAKWIREIGYAKCEIVSDIHDGIPIRDRRRSPNRTSTKRKARKK